MITGNNPAAGGDCAGRNDAEHAASQRDCARAPAPSIGQRIVAVIAFVLSAAALLACLVVVVGVWVVKPRATAKATMVFGRVENALDVAEENLDLVQASLARAAERLDSAREEQRKLAQEPQPNTALTRVVARSVLPRMAPDLGNAQEKLHTVAEAAVVVNSVLEDVGSFPLLSVAGLDIDRLTEMNDRLADVGPAAWELSRLIGDPEDAEAAGAGLPDRTDVADRAGIDRRICAPAGGRASANRLAGVHDAWLDDAGRDPHLAGLPVDCPVAAQRHVARPELVDALVHEGRHAAGK